ncbi:MAG: CoA transferase [Spirochaetales bacterium]|nr:CoA transferase [Spirochaetales bacterium]
MSIPLEGIKVLDLTRVLAGPFCTMMLQDLGAEVLKIEAPGTGDDSRSFGPFKNGRSLYFVSINRGKKSMTLNLKHPQGKEILRSLVARHDILVENFRPGVMEKLGFGWDELHRINPRLIYASSSGYGHTGPASRKPAYDILAQAEGGVMSITGLPGAEPVRVGCSIGDITASLFTANGIMAALYQRQSTGVGCKIDVAMLDCQVAILENALVRYQVAGTPPGPLGTRHPTIAPFQAYRAADEYIIIAVGNDSLWESFCGALEQPELAHDPRFTTNKDRTEHLQELNAILEPLILRRTAGEWEETLEKAQVPHSRINTVDRLMEHPQVLARNMLVSVDDSVAGPVRIAGNPIKISDMEDRVTRPRVPELGEHTEEVLTALGYTGEEIVAFKEEGVT